MRVRVSMPIADRQVDEELEGASADEVVAKAKARVAQALGWKGLFLNALTPLAFAQKAVQLYNEKNETQYDLPQSADEFLRLGKDLGYVTVLSED